MTEMGSQCAVSYYASMKSVFTRNFADWVKYLIQARILNLFPKFQRKVLRRFADYICFRIIGPKGKLYSDKEKKGNDDEEEDEDDVVDDPYTADLNRGMDLEEFVLFLCKKFKVKSGDTKVVCIQVSLIPLNTGPGCVCRRGRGNISLLLLHT